MGAMNMAKARGPRHRRIGDMRQESVSLPRPPAERVTEAADRFHVSRGLLMRLAIKHGLPGAIRALRRDEEAAATDGRGRGPVSHGASGEAA